MNYFEIISQFDLESSAVSCKPFGNGHINSTFVVKTQSGRRYILQKLSEEAFKDVPALMENISGVTDYLDAKAKADGTVCHVLAPIKTKNGSTFIQVTDIAGTADTTEIASADAASDVNTPNLFYSWKYWFMTIITIPDRYRCSKYSLS